MPVELLQTQSVAMCLVFLKYMIFSFAYFLKRPLAICYGMGSMLIQINKYFLSEYPNMLYLLNICCILVK